MKIMDLYARVRRARHVEGMSQRQAARVFGIDAKTVAKMLRLAIAPVGQHDAILVMDQWYVPSEQPNRLALPRRTPLSLRLRIVAVLGDAEALGFSACSGPRGIAREA
jgi:hypothetical protein